MVKGMKLPIQWTARYTLCNQLKTKMITLSSFKTLKVDQLIEEASQPNAAWQTGLRKMADGLFSNLTILIIHHHLIKTSTLTVSVYKIKLEIFFFVPLVFDYGVILELDHGLCECRYK